jgi:type VI secretion system protein VasD
MADDKGLPLHGARIALLCCAGAAILAGCAPPPPPPPPKPAIVVGTVQVDPSVNPDANGRPSPVVVRFYELKAIAVFRSSDFFSVFDREQQTLGTEMVAREEFRLEPGDKRTFKRTLQGDTKFLGVVAAYRDLDHSQWRAMINVIPEATQPAVIRVEANKISIRSN